MNYDVDYFIAKFEAIPEERWCEGTYDDLTGRHCALGHCGIRFEAGKSSNPEGDALVKLTATEAVNINDGHDGRYEQPTPKQRIIAALLDIKSKQEATCSH
jgi:hypothetical protein